MLLNYLLNDKSLALTKMKTFADKRFNVATMMIAVFDGDESYGKRRKCWLPVFSSFPTIFSKELHFCFVKTLDCMAKSYFFNQVTKF